MACPLTVLAPTERATRDSTEPTFVDRKLAPSRGSFYSPAMDLDRYLTRIGFAGEPTLSYDTLIGLARAQVRATTFENLDVQLGRRTTLDPKHAYEKIVERGRGGWCYELNGLLGWALSEIGFRVTRIAATVERTAVGAGEFPHDHLCLLVTFEEEQFLVDAGFGGSLLEPMPLRPHRRHDIPYAVELHHTGVNTWRFCEHLEDRTSHFDFELTPADDALLAITNAKLQTDEDSPFVRNLVVQRRFEDHHLILRGRVVSEVRAGQLRKRTLASPDELLMALREGFQLDVPKAAELWPKIVARHAGLFGAGEGSDATQ